MTNRGRRTTPGKEGIDAARAEARTMGLKELGAARATALRDIAVRLEESQNRAEDLDRLLRAQGHAADADELDDLLGYLQLALEAQQRLTG